MDEDAIQREKNKRIGGGAFWFLLLFEMPVLVMWLVGYIGIGFLIWLALVWLLVGYYRATRTTYLYHVGQSDPAQLQIMDYQERPWLFLMPIPFWVGSLAMLNLGSAADVDLWIVSAAVCCFALMAIVCVIEFFRKVRF